MAFATFVHDRGTHAARPAAAAGNSGYYYFETDTGQWFVSSGASWAKALGPAATVSLSSITLAADILNALGAAGIVTVTA